MPAYSPTQIPTPTPETAPFWEATKRGELLFQRCTVDGTTFMYWRREPFCPACRSGKVETLTASGRGFVYSYVINQRNMPGMLPAPPSVIALVELDEGPRLVAALSDVDPTPAGVQLDMPVTVRFEQRGDQAVPYFVPEI